MKKDDTLYVRVFTEKGPVEFVVSGDEWRAELPLEGLNAWSLPVRDYQARAAYKKAAKVTPHRIRALQFRGR